MVNGPKVLVFDIETAPILGYVWSLWENNVALNQIKSDWHVMSWSAKWLKGEDGVVYGPHDKIMYMDQRNAKDIENDKELIKGIWKLLDEADIVITQNGKKFDSRKLNARFILNGLKKPSPYKHIDVKEIVNRHFAFTSSKLEYMTDKLNKKFKKIKHEEFGGFELWRECKAGNLAAWKAMEKYNKYDVLSLEELYHIVSPWERVVDFNLYSDSIETKCNCGSVHFQKRGFSYTGSGKFQKLQCQKCGAWITLRGAANNRLSKAKRASLKGKA